MGRKLAKPCIVSTCPNFARPNSQRCETHQKKEWARIDQQKKDNGSFNDFYRTYAWKKLREYHLRGEPLCRKCGQPGRVVDHIVPISEGGDPLEHDNLQTMCDLCHNRKRQQESQRKKFSS